jgi:hypothetical protein
MSGTLRTHKIILIKFFSVLYLREIYTWNIKSSCIPIKKYKQANFKLGKKKYQKNPMRKHSGSLFIREEIWYYQGEDTAMHSQGYLTFKKVEKGKAWQWKNWNSYPCLVGTQNVTSYLKMCLLIYVKSKHMHALGINNTWAQISEKLVHSGKKVIYKNIQNTFIHNSQK